MHADERREISVLEVLLVISIILYLGTGAFLNLTINQLRNVVEAQSNEIAELNRQVSSLRGEVNLLRERMQNATVPTFISYSELYSEVKDSVVFIQGWVLIETIFGREYTTVQGSGFVYNYGEDMIVITNDHVVVGSVNITVSFLNGNTYPADIVGEDPYSDLAVLSVYAPAHEFKPLAIASSSTLEVGQPVVAVGNPFGLTGSMTTGVISQLGRTLSETVTGGYPVADIIQMSAPINPGNSGGPLLNVFGEVIGVTTAIVTNSQGLGFAVPSDTILRELPFLVEHRPYPHPWLGVRGVDITYEVSKAVNFNVTYGWLIVEVLLGSPAEEAGLRGGTEVVDIGGVSVTIGGDAVIAIDGTRIRNGDDLTTYLERNTKTGQKIVVTIIRSEHKMDIIVTLGTRPPIS